MDDRMLYEKAKEGIEAGFSIATHAIGDRANQLVMDAYEQLRMEGIADADTILRIEHTQIMKEEDIERMHHFDIKSIPQSIHCISDAMMAKARLGKRDSIAYPWRSLIDHGLKPAGSSDFPIESANPLLGIDAYCRRVPMNQDEAWMPEEIITQQEALLSYTRWAHEASGLEYRRGALSLKYDADITILDSDIVACSVEHIKNIKVLATYSAGIRRFHGQ